MGRRLALPLVLLIAAAAAGCTGQDGAGDDASESLPWQAETSETGPVELTPEEAAMAAVEDYWRVIDEAAAIPDPQYEALHDVASDQALDGAIAMVQEQADEGTRIDGGITLSATSVVERTPEEDPTEIVVDTCVDNSTAVVVDAETGAPVAEAAYGRRQARAVVLLDESGWFVRAIHTQEIGTC